MKSYRWSYKESGNPKENYHVEFWRSKARRPTFKMDFYEDGSVSVKIRTIWRYDFPSDRIKSSDKDHPWTIMEKDEPTAKRIEIFKNKTLYFTLFLEHTGPTMFFDEIMNTARLCFE